MTVHEVFQFKVYFYCCVAILAVHAAKHVYIDFYNIGTVVLLQNNLIY